MGRLVYDIILLLVLGWVGLLSSIKDVAEVGSSNVIEMEPGNLLELSLRRVLRLKLPLDELPTTLRVKAAEEAILMMAEEVERRAVRLLLWLAHNDSTFGLILAQE